MVYGHFLSVAIECCLTLAGLLPVDRRLSGPEDCVELTVADNRWNGVPCALTFPFVCDIRAYKCDGIRTFIGFDGLVVSNTRPQAGAELHKQRDELLISSVKQQYHHQLQAAGDRRTGDLTSWRPAGRMNSADVSARRVFRPLRRSPQATRAPSALRSACCGCATPRTNPAESWC